MGKFSFPRSARLHGRRNFESVFNDGRRHSTRDLAMWSCAPSDKCAAGAGRELGLVVSKKTGGAVRRNRLKRLLREAFRTSKDSLLDGTRIIVYPKAGCGIRTLLQAKTALKAVWARAGLAIGAV